MRFQGELNPEWNLSDSSFVLKVFSQAPLSRAVTEEMRKYINGC